MSITVSRLNRLIFFFRGSYLDYFRMINIRKNPKDGGSTVLRNVGIQPRYYMAQEPRKPRILSSPPWKPQISLQCTRTSMSNDNRLRYFKFRRAIPKTVFKSYETYKSDSYYKFQDFYVNSELKPSRSWGMQRHCRQSPKLPDSRKKSPPVTHDNDSNIIQLSSFHTHHIWNLQHVFWLGDILPIQNFEMGVK